MRRLNKKVWLLNYNGEAHNLVERRNRKDIQIREQQYFDWLLKGEKPPKWIVEGVPAVKKGKDWGLEIVNPDHKEYRISNINAEYRRVSGLQLLSYPS